MLDENERNVALEAEDKYKTAVESANDYIENFDILETITNVGNDEVFTPRKTCDMILDSLPDEVWHNKNYKWLNPATKNGIFEREIAIRLDEGLKDQIPDTEQRRKHILQNMIYSIGQTRFTANVARRTVYYCSQANRKCDGIQATDGHYVNGYAIGNGTWFDDEEGNILTPNINHTFVDDKGNTMSDSCTTEAKKKYRCKYCGINGASSYNDANQLETYAYEFIHFNGNELLKHLQDRFFGGNKEMKFDIIIGNPPYQLSDGGGTGDSSKPIYNKFVEQAKLLKPKFISMIIPSRWMKGGKGLDDFRNNMINDTHIEILYDFEIAKNCFPLNTIDGGVCYFLWDSNYNGVCKYTYESKDGFKDVSTRLLNNGLTGNVIRDSRQISIIEKAKGNNNQSFSKIVSTRKPFGISTDLFNAPENYKNFNLQNEYYANSYKIYGVKGNKGGAKRVIGFVDTSAPSDNISSIKKYKLFFSYAYSTDSTVPPEIIVGKPDEIATETFLMIGPFENESFAKNCLSYIKTKFFRALLYFNRIQKNCSKETFNLIPLVSFSLKWNDKMLYEKFQLTKDEIQYIENNIKEMK